MLIFSCVCDTITNLPINVRKWSVCWNLSIKKVDVACWDAAAHRFVVASTVPRMQFPAADRLIARNSGSDWSQIGRPRFRLPPLFQRGGGCQVKQCAVAQVSRLVRRWRGLPDDFVTGGTLLTTQDSPALVTRLQVQRLPGLLVRQQTLR